jgi:hypothetical protein
MKKLPLLSENAIPKSNLFVDKQMFGIRSRRSTKQHLSVVANLNDARRAAATRRRATTDRF